MKDEKIRCYIIADDYRWHVLTDSPEEYHQYTLAYLELMSTSSKENQYYFRNVFLNRSEYLILKKNLSHRKTQGTTPITNQTQEKKKKETHLYLVD